MRPSNYLKQKPSLIYFPDVGMVCYKMAHMELDNSRSFICVMGPRIFTVPPKKTWNILWMLYNIYHWEKIHPRKLTWNLKMMVFHRNLLFQGFIFRFHVSFRGCIIKIQVSIFHSFIPQQVSTNAGCGFDPNSSCCSSKMNGFDRLYTSYSNN